MDSEYDIDGMIEYFKNDGCIDCRSDKTGRIADAISSLGFNMGCWYTEWNRSAWVGVYDYMYMAHGEIHLTSGRSFNVCMTFEDFLDEYKVENDAEPAEIDLSILFG